MREAGRGSGIRLAATAATVATLLAGCGGGAPGSGASSTLANLIAFNSPSAPPTPTSVDPNARKLITCPEIEVLDGGGALRVGGPSSASVRHQFSMGDVARECDLQGGQIAIKVGVEGNVIIGPAGGTGAFSAPLRIAIRQEKDQKIVVSRAYRVSATVPAGAGQGPFQLISDPIVVPFVSEDAGSDYTVLVQFGGAGSDARERRRRRR